MRIVRKNQCHKVQGLLSPYIDGQIGSSEREKVESHLEECQICFRELESLRATINLLHRVAVVSPPRSFALAEVEAKRRPAAQTSEAPQWRRVPALGAMRVATAVAALLLIFVLAGDTTHLFEAGPVENRATQQGTPVADEVMASGGAPSDSEGFTYGEDYLAGDTTPPFEAGPVENGATQQGTPVADEVMASGGASSDSEGFTDGEGYIWPVLELELVLAGVVLILGGATAVLWHRKRKGLEKG